MSELADVNFPLGSWSMCSSAATPPDSMSVRRFNAANRDWMFWMLHAQLKFGETIPLEAVTEEQFDAVSLWEYVYQDDSLPGWYDWSVRPCTNSKQLPEDVEMMLVTVDAIVAEGTKTIGCCHLRSKSPHLFSASLAFESNWFSLGHDKECSEFVEAIGKDTADVFPIRIVSRVRLPTAAIPPDCSVRMAIFCQCDHDQ